LQLECGAQSSAKIWICGYGLRILRRAPPELIPAFRHDNFRGNAALAVDVARLLRHFRLAA